MKKTKIIYWVFTILFSAAMIFSAWGDFLLDPKAVEFMTHLGYPNYFTHFIGAAKIIGAIAILLPIPSRLKEWAYAGLFFDLVGAVWSMVAVEGFQPAMAGILIWFILFAGSYIYWRKLERMKAQQKQAQNHHNHDPK